MGMAITRNLFLFLFFFFFTYIFDDAIGTKTRRNERLMASPTPVRLISIGPYKKDLISRAEN